MDDVTLYVDGGCLGGNPGHAIYWSAALERDGDREMLIERQRSPQYGRNNAAEWKALHEGLKALREATEPPLTVTVLSDSQLIVNQFNGTWKCRDPRMSGFRRKTVALETLMESEGYELTVEWTPRENIEPVLGH